MPSPIIIGFFMAIGILLVSTPARAIPVGSGSYTFIDTSAQTWIVPVWTYRPEHAGTNAPIVFVCHGLNRNGESYRNAWIQSAERLGFILIVPEFTTQSFPGSRSYNQGNIFASNGNLNPVGQWSFQVIERVFDDVVAKTSSTQERYHLYGHSAGAQFVHRMLMLMPNIRVERAVSSNAGWYTLPDFEADYPYGLRNSPYQPAMLNERFLQNHLVLLGTEDNNPNDSSLNRTPETDVQGIHRYERGHYFFDKASAYANSQGIKLGWSLGYAPGIGHSNSAMASYAANWLIHPWQGLGSTLYNNVGSFYRQTFTRGLPANTNTEAIWSDNETFPGFFVCFQKQGTPLKYRIHNESEEGAFHHWRLDNQSVIGLIGGRPGEQSGDMHFGIRLTNNTGEILDRVSIGYIGAQYYNSQSGIAGSIDFAYQSGVPAGLDEGDWVKVPSLTFYGPYSGDGLSEPVKINPYNSLSRETFSPVMVTGVRWFPGETLWVRWTVIHQAGANHGLGIDNIVITAESVELTVPGILPQPVITFEADEPHWTVFLPLHPLGLNYQLQQSANLAHWQSVVSAPPVEDLTGLYWKIDPLPDSAFLRIVASPP